MPLEEKEAGPTMGDNDGTIPTTTSCCRRGWVVVPTPNRVLVFNGSLLHCVLPGVGPRPMVATDDASDRGGVGNGGPGAHGDEETEPSRKRQRKSPHDDRRDAGPSSKAETEPEPRRLTFMVALWEEDPRAPPVPQAHPEETAGPAWPTTFVAPLTKMTKTEDGQAGWTPVRNLTAVRKVDKIWEAVGDGKGDGDGEDGGNGDGEGAGGGAGAGGGTDRVDLLSDR